MYINDGMFRGNVGYFHANKGTVMTLCFHSILSISSPTSVEDTHQRVHFHSHATNS